MQKTTCTLLLLTFSVVISGQNKSTVYWTGTMNRDNSIMNVSVEFKPENGKTHGYFNSPSQKASGIPLDSVVIHDDSLSFQLMSEPVTYFKCKVYTDKIEGQIIQEGFSSGRLVIHHSTRPLTTYSFTDTTFESGKNKIACRIYFPKRNGKFPAIVFMHGSGGEGMFANQYLAEYLASNGIITLIQDKQGVGKSTGNWTKATFEDLTNDYVNAIACIKKFDKVNQAQIGIYGHSQGGTLAPLLASKSKDVSFVIAAASVGDTIFKQDIYRVESNLKSAEFNPAEIHEAMAYYTSWLNIARTGKGFDKLDSLNQLSQDKKWIEWVKAPPKNHWIWNYYLGTGNYNSLDFWKKVTIPVLLVYGENDQIEDIKTYLHNIDKSINSEHLNNDITELILPNAQHNLCVFPEKNKPFFWWYLSHGYEKLIVSWIVYRFRN